MKRLSRLALRAGLIPAAALVACSGPTDDGSELANDASTVRDSPAEEDATKGPNDAARSIDASSTIQPDATPADASVADGEGTGDAPIDNTLRNASDAGPAIGADGGDSMASDAEAGGSLCSTNCGPGLSLCNGVCSSPLFCTVVVAWQCAIPALSCPEIAHTIFACGATPSDPCVLQACDPGWADCNGDPTDGCEVDLLSPDNCGACGVTCDGTLPLCGTNGCEATCQPNETACGDGTCPDLNTSMAHCGSCTTACAGTFGPNTIGCNAGTCGPLTCAPGTVACNGNCVAESTVTCGGVCGIDLTTDPNNCGACNHSCVVANEQFPQCIESTCFFQCQPPFLAVCDGTCVATSIDPKNCGTCGHACAAGEICEDPGRCVAPGSLLLATSVGSPVELATDADHIFWFDSAALTVNAMAKSGGAVTILASSQVGLSTAVPPTIDGAYVYWSAAGAIFRTRTDGTGAVENAMSVAPQDWTVQQGLIYSPAALPDSDYYVINAAPVDGGPGTQAGSLFGYSPVFEDIPYPGPPFTGNPLQGMVSDGQGIYYLGCSLHGGESCGICDLQPPITSAPCYQIDEADYPGTAPLSLQVGPLGGYYGSVFATGSMGVVSNPFQPAGKSPTYAPWAPSPCGVVFDDPGGLDVSVDEGGFASVLDGATIAAMGGLLQLVYDADGYVYFIDGRHEIGRIAAY